MSRNVTSRVGRGENGRKERGGDQEMRKNGYKGGKRGKEGRGEREGATLKKVLALTQGRRCPSDVSGPVTSAARKSVLSPGRTQEGRTSLGPGSRYVSGRCRSRRKTLPDCPEGGDAGKQAGRE